MMDIKQKKIAIYSRKSKYTGAGDSIENQIEMCKEYTAVQFGKDREFLIYEDEGFSGKNTDRPEFQRLLRDMQDNLFDVLVCYRLDRISRSVSDFSNVLDELNDRGISFVSIRENFDTSTPMGRAMIHIASVFAELERETIAERVKDNKYKLYRTGHWQGGKPPLGFESVKVQNIDENGDKRSFYMLRPIEEQLPLVHMLFDKYIELGSLNKLETYLLQNRISTPSGNEFTKSALRHIIRNPVYAANNPCVYDFLRLHGADLANSREEYDGIHGLIGYGKTATKGIKNSTRVRLACNEWIIATSQHKGIIPGDRWVKAQIQMAVNKQKYPRTDSSNIALFSGLIKCGKCGAPMTVKGNRINVNGEKTFYYKCSRKDRSAGKLCDIKNINGADFDRSIIELLKNRFCNGDNLFEIIKNSFIYKTIDYSRQINDLTCKIKDYDIQSVHLAMKLAKNKSDETDAPIYAAIKKCSLESAELKKQLDALIIKSLTAKSDEFNLELIRDAMQSFCSAIDSKSVDVKRETLNLLIKNIVWRDDNFTVELFAHTIESKK